MKVLTTCGAVAAMIAVTGAANAATTHDVTSPTTQNDIGDGGVYGTVLNIGDIASVDVKTDVDGDTDSALGFDYQPNFATQRFQLSLNGFETGLYGSINAYLSDDDEISADDVMATSVDSTDGFGGPRQDLFAESKFANGRFFVLLDWENEANNSFSYDVAVSPAAVPVPAAGFLLLGAVGGMAALRRRKRAA